MLVLETGAGLTNATSYASVADADAYWLARGGAPDGWEDAAAAASVTISTQVSNGDTITVGSKTYTFQTTLTNVDGNIAIGSSVSQTRARLERAINLSGEGGTDYAALMTENADVECGEFDETGAATLTARVGGSAGNELALSEAFADADNVVTVFGGGVDTRDAALVRATDSIERQNQGTWRGRKKTSEQALSWPRVGARDDDGFAISDVSVPSALKNATIELAASAAIEDIEPDLESPGNVIEESVKVGSLAETVKYSGGKSPYKKYTRASRLLEGLTTAGTVERA